MIKTTTPQAINSRTGESAIVYLKLLNKVSDSLKQTEVFYIASMILQDDGNFKQFEDTIIATYKKETYLTIFGSQTLQEFSDNEDANMIAQIDYSTNNVETGDELYPAPKFWGLTSSDLEVVT